MGSNDTKTRESQRKQTRYAVSEDCRIRASIRVRSSDAASSNKDWSGTLVDMSAGGAHIQISLGAVAYKGDTCTLKLAHGGVQTELRGILAHYVCSTRHSVCGVKFDDFSEGWDRAYQLFLKAVAASTTLKGGAAGSDAPGRYREEYTGLGHAKLVVWRDDTPERALVGFDYAMARYGAALTTVGPDMLKNKEQVRLYVVASGGGDAGIQLVRSQEMDARWEFSLAASNLPKALAPDLRRFLRLVS
ncbi:MAG: PilZ domain-containing protein [Opitutae bacterium]|nr:PilZ domain-containing protein [Opitutae bacterium]